MNNLFWLAVALTVVCSGFALGAWLEARGRMTEQTIALGITLLCAIPPGVAWLAYWMVKP